MAEVNPRIRILHLEDNLREAAMIEELLKSEGLNCEIWRVGGRVAFEAALANGSWDVVLTDYNLPDFDGPSAIALARQKQPDVPIIVLSGSIGEQDAVKCLQLGATDYLLKERLNRLAPAITRALEQSAQLRFTRQTETARRMSEARFAAIFHSAAVPIGYGSLDGRMIDVNPAYCEFFGYERDELVGRRVAELNLWVRLEQRTDILDILNRGKTVRQHEVEFRRKSGEIRTALLSFEKLEVDSEPMLLAMLTDISERKALQAHLQRLQRVESVGLLASGIAHDMNNILAPIIMAVPLLRMGLPPEAVEKMHSTIEISAQRGAALVRQLLIFGRGVEGERRPLRIADIVKEVTQIARETFPRSIAFREDVPDNVWPIIGDASQLHQVVLNFCVNARDAMPEGGTLSIAAQNVEVDPYYAAQHRDAKPGKYVVLRISDTGMGIAPEVADRIFDPFFTTKAPGKGTGLGLSTVLGIVKSHGGFIRLQSAVQRGSCFETHLPATAPTAIVQPAEPAAVGIMGRGEMILVVDDEEQIRAILRALLVRHNYRVVTAQDGVEATAVFAANIGTIKLVITDLDMPLMDGANLTRVFRRIDPEVKIIISTGLADEQQMTPRGTELADLAVTAVLMKPHSPNRLLTAVRDALASDSIQ